MGISLGLAVLLAGVALGAFSIHRLNYQHADQLARRQHSRRLPGEWRDSHSVEPVAPDAPDAPDDSSDHKDAG